MEILQQFVQSNIHTHMSSDLFQKYAFMTYRFIKEIWNVSVEHKWSVCVCVCEGRSTDLKFPLSIFKVMMSFGISSLSVMNSLNFLPKVLNFSPLSYHTLVEINKFLCNSNDNLIITISDILLQNLSDDNSHDTRNWVENGFKFTQNESPKYCNSTPLQQNHAE